VCSSIRRGRYCFPSLNCVKTDEPVAVQCSAGVRSNPERFRSRLRALSTRRGSCTSPSIVDFTVCMFGTCQNDEGVWYNSQLCLHFKNDGTVVGWGLDREKLQCWYSNFDIEQLGGPTLSRLTGSWSPCGIISFEQAPVYVDGITSHFCEDFQRTCGALDNEFLDPVTIHPFKLADDSSIDSFEDESSEAGLNADSEFRGDEGVHCTGDESSQGYFFEGLFVGGVFEGVWSRSEPYPEAAERGTFCYLPKSESKNYMGTNSRCVLAEIEEGGEGQEGAENEEHEDAASCTRSSENVNQNLRCAPSEPK